MTKPAEASKNTQAVQELQRCAIYARYSSAKQRESSIEDQVRKCREYAARQNWTILDDFIRSDQEITGAVYEERSGLQSLMNSAGQNPRPFDLLLLDSTSRLARNVEDQLFTIKMLGFYGVNVVAISQGLDSRQGSSRMSFALHGIIDEQFLDDLSKSVHRGQVGRVLTDKYIAGGRCYGYKNVPDEHPTRIGEYGRPLVLGVTRKIIREEAAVVQRIFTMYAEGLSLDKIAKALRADNVPAPRPPRRNSLVGWSPDGISAILQNQIYLGRYIWNRTTNLRDPKTRRIVTRPNPESEWKTSERPDWRIVSDELWNRAQEQREFKRHFGVRKVGGLERTKRSQGYLFGGLLYCGICGGSIRIVDTESDMLVRYGCGVRRDKGACTNAVNIRRDQLEGQLLTWFTQDLLQDERTTEAVRSFYTELRKRIVQLQNEVTRNAANAPELRAELAQKTTDAENIADYIMKNGARSSATLQTRLVELEARIQQINELLSRTANNERINFSIDEVKDYLLGKLLILKSELAKTPQNGKLVFRKFVKKIILTPCDAHGKKALTVKVEFNTGGGHDSTVLLPESLGCLLARYETSGFGIENPRTY